MSIYYRTCPYCGANLDPGERCDCMRQTHDVYRAFIRKALAQKKVPAILCPLCLHALENPSTPADTLHTLCTKIKEFEKEI